MNEAGIGSNELAAKSRKRTLLLASLLLAFHPVFLGAERLTTTTYYPAPYAGYAKLLTSGNAALARDAGRVGIGAINNSYKLNVAGTANASGTISAADVMSGPATSRKRVITGIVCSTGLRCSISGNNITIRLTPTTCRR